MQNKRTKFWFGFGIFSAIVCIVAVVCLTCFRLKNVSVSFLQRTGNGDIRNQTMLEEGVLENIKHSGEFDYGGNILFMKFDENIKKIEKAHPYAKVYTIKRSFPCNASVYIVERTPKFRVKDKNSNYWYILDEDFKILDILANVEAENSYGTSTYFDNTFEIDNNILDFEGEEGDFVSGYDTEKLIFNNLAKAAYGKNETYGDVRFASIDKNESQLVFYMKNSLEVDKKGCKIIVNGLDKVKEMSLVGISEFYDKYTSNNTSSTVLVVSVGAQGYIVSPEN